MDIFSVKYLLSWKASIELDSQSSGKVKLTGPRFRIGYIQVISYLKSSFSLITRCAGLNSCELIGKDKDKKIK